MCGQWDRGLFNATCEPGGAPAPICEWYWEDLSWLGFTVPVLVSRSHKSQVEPVPKSLDIN